MPDRASRAFDEWSRERPELDPRPMVVIGRLNEAAQRIGRDHLRPFFARHGLQPGEFDVLATLRRAGAPFALTPTELYEATMVTSGAMTGRIDSLEKAGWVERQPSAEDRRVVRVALTEAGFALIDRIIADHVMNQRRVLQSLSEEEQATLAQLLEKLIAGLPAAD